MIRSRRHRLTPPALPSVALAALAFALAAPAACGEAGGGAPPDGTAGSGGGTTAGTGGGGTGGTGGTGGSTNGMGSGGAGGVAPSDPFASGAELRVPVTAGQRSYVRLDPLSLVTPADPAAATDWDLAFENYDVYTNGGVSGPGKASAFGPFLPEEFATSPTPMPPFTITDEAGGAFRRWYYYEGAPRHVLWSRYHIFGIKDGDQHWKVQILSYYTERDGAPVSALYTIRYASIGAGGVGPLQDNVVVDGTGTNTEQGLKAECIDLGTGAIVAHTEAEALAASDWHLCFRRQSISVNGELGGPRGVTAIDFEAAATEAETLAQMKAIDADKGAQLARFDALTFDRFASATLRGDRAISAFGEGWVNATTAPPTPEAASWLVKGADGVATHMIGFAGFDGASAAGPGTIVLRAKKFGP